MLRVIDAVKITMLTREVFFSLAFGLIINNWSGEICYTDEPHIYAFAFKVPAIRPQLQT